MFKTNPDVDIRPNLIDAGGALSARSVLADKRGLSTSVPEALGALALGVIVIGATAVGIGAAYNYGQDSSAKSTLDAVKSAEVLYQAKNAAFADVAGLTTGTDPALIKSSATLAIAKTDKDYCAAIQSSSMYAPSFWITAKSGTVLTTKPDAASAGVTCPDPATPPAS